MLHPAWAGIGRDSTIHYFEGKLWMHHSGTGQSEGLTYLECVYMQSELKVSLSLASKLVVSNNALVLSPGL